MPTEFDIECGRSNPANLDEVNCNLFDAAYCDFGRAEQPGDQEDDPDEVFCAPADDEDKVSDTTSKSYIKTMETLRKNGGTTKESVESFKRAIDALKDLDAKKIEKELEAGAKDPNVRSLDVLMHLKEALQETGFKVIAYQPDTTNGSVILKNEKTETYIQMQFSREKGNEGASVKIQNKR